MGGEQIAAFVPHALPPRAPAIVVDAALTERLRAAERALVRLDGLRVGTELARSTADRP